MEQLSIVTHVEWSTSDPKQLTDFLTGLFGWKFNAFGQDYFFCDPGSGVTIGVLHNTQAHPGGTPNVYIKVTSVDETMARALELGGQIAVPKKEIPNMGSYGFVSSPEKNLIGLHESL